MEIEKKKKLIKAKDEDGYLVFKPWSNETLYAIPELTAILKGIVGIKIPRGTIVQRKHWVTYRILELLGYRKPRGLRIREARQSKPKFKHQMLDIFIQQHSNLQIWNYLPYTTERYNCRYLIIKIENNKIKGFVIKTGKELKEWDTTGTKTIKWQAIISDKTRNDAENKILMSKKDPMFRKFNITKNNLAPIEDRIIKIKELQKEKKFLISSSPHPKLLFSISEMGILLKPLIDTKIKLASEKLLGQIFQKLVASKLGYHIEEGMPVNSGQTPDLINQLIEIKLQMSPTIDLGYHLPVSNEPLDFAWNKNGLAPLDIRYVVGLADEVKKDVVEITGIIIASGREFEDFFSICEGTNFKVQMTIPDFNNI